MPEGTLSMAQSSQIARDNARFVPGAARLRMRSMICLSGKATLNYIKINNLMGFEEQKANSTTSGFRYPCTLV